MPSPAPLIPSRVVFIFFHAEILDPSRVRLFVHRPSTILSCDCDRKSSNGGNCDSGGKECEPTFAFETTSSPKMLYAPMFSGRRAHQYFFNGVDMPVAAATESTSWALLVAATLLVILAVHATHDLLRSWLYYRGAVTQSCRDSVPAAGPLRHDFLTPELPSLGQYAYYYATLRTDYFLTASWRALAHATALLLVRLGLHRGSADYAAQLGRLFLDTTLVLFVMDVRHLCCSSSSSPSAERLRPLLATFVARDFHVPFEFNTARCRRIRELRVNVLLPECIATAAVADDIDVDMQTALRLAFWLLMMQHTRIHSAATAACQLGHTHPEVRLASVYTLSINIAATLGAAPWSYQTPDQMKAMIALNIGEEDSRKPAHDFVLLNLVAAHSATFRFLMHARQVTFAVLAEQGLQLDPESFYLETVIHSVDHCAAAAIVDPLSLITAAPDGRHWCANSNWICALFVNRIWRLLADTCLRTSTVAWHRDWYGRLAAIDTRWADVVDWCIAY
ncbi:hypothetical protein R1flu_022035 [Riccia fluitans]|uniref:Uncharacterized protein n=1 Tax=Riccia fluitans TaxID=41844 RepID=A0ABD1ZRQ2_9MARC